MKYIINVIVGIWSLLCLQVTYAGAMGPMDLSMVRIKQFVGAEAAATWLIMNNFRVDAPSRVAILPANVVGIWGGRISGGMMIPYNREFYFTAETGWNYFGHGSLTSNYAFSGTLEGADLLVGAAYKYSKKLDFFAKFGTLFERFVVSVRRTHLLATINNEPTFVDLSLKGPILDTIPEVKVGGAYHLTNELDITLSYMHSFGSDPNFRILHTSTDSDGYRHLIMDIDARGPALNSIMLGLQYTFV